jgi:predicted PurR-regulated permease PerM/CheY-like chemotaxis protein
MNKLIPASAKEQLWAATGLMIISAILYFGRTLLIPMLLAILLSFVLTPFVVYLQKRGVQRIIAVTLVMAAALLGIGSLGLAVYSQVGALATDLPAKKEHIIEKIRFFTGTGPSPLSRLVSLFEDINTDINNKVQQVPKKTDEPKPLAEPEPPKNDKTPEKTIVPVTVKESPSNLMNLSTLAVSIQHFLGFVTLTIGLCASMLLRHEDLRNRLISLVGQGHLTSTTKAMEEVNRRITKYLLGQVIFNSMFGLLFGIGLLILQVDYALLWGLLAFVLRFIPGLGTWMAAIIPIIISLATPGWWQPSFVLLLTAILGIVFNYVLEPIIFSKRTGVSIVSLVIMAAFWTWLWGMPGLVLATPISVCLLVLGSHIPMFHFLYVLLAEGSVLDSDLGFYQRLLADDEDEAAYLIETYLEDHTHEQLASEVIIPTLINAQRDVSNQLISPEEMSRMLSTTKRLVEQAFQEEEETEKTAPGAGLLLGIASHDPREGLALNLLDELLPREAGRLESISAMATVSEIVQQIRDQKPTAVCIASMPPRGTGQSRMRCKRLRSTFPDLPIIMALWGYETNADEAKTMLEAGATKVTWTLQETSDAVVPLLRIATHQQDTLAAK